MEYSYGITLWNKVMEYDWKVIDDFLGSITFILDHQALNGPGHSIQRQKSSQELALIYKNSQVASIVRISINASPNIYCIYAIGNGSGT